MIEFIDPRSNPKPPARVVREPAAHGNDLRELIRLCLAGYVYDVERWIQSGEPIQALQYKRPRKPAVVSPLRTAIRKKNRDLVLLLLCNGYRLDLEPGEPESVLDEALAVRALDILDLLLEWGADPRAVQTYNIIDTYKSDLIEWFWTNGVDFSADPEFASYLAHTVNKPLYGWLRRNRSDYRLQDALDIALLDAVTSDEELPVRLLLWAGANPHRRVPAIRDLVRGEAWNDEYAIFSSAAAAITFGRHQLLDLLRIGAMPDLDDQFPWAHDSWTLKRLVALGRPSDWSATILAFIGRLLQPSGRYPWEVRDALGFIASVGGKLVIATPDQIGYLRRVLLKLRDIDTFLWLLRWLRNEKHCVPAIYEDVTGTKSMRQKVEAIGAGARYLKAPGKAGRGASRCANTASMRA
jgi:hypothetical protein